MSRWHPPHTSRGWVYYLRVRHLVRHEFGGVVYVCGKGKARLRADNTAHICGRLHISMTDLTRANTLSPRTRRCCKSENQLCKSNHTYVTF